MSRPFRPSYISYDWAPWLGWFAIAAGIVGMVLLLSWCGEMEREDCEAKGGELVHARGYKYGNTLCVKPGTVLE